MSPALESVGVPIESPIERPDELIPGFLPAKGQLVIAGETNIGKSLIALEICSSLLTEAPLWGSLQPKRGVKKALYILAEHHTGTLQELWAKTGLPAPPKSLWVVGPHEFHDHHLVARGMIQPQVRANLLEWSTGCDLVVYDPLSAFIRGENVENDNAQMRLVVDTLTNIANDNGAGCVILAHIGKPGLEEAPKRDYRIRGASAVEDAASAIFYMEQGSQPDIFTLRRRKYKGPQEPKTYSLVRDSATLTHTLFHGRRPLGIQRAEFLAKLKKEPFASMPPTDAVRQLCELEGVGERTGWAWLQAQT